MPSEYRIFEARQFEKDIRHLARAGHRELLGKLHQTVYPQLRTRPHFGPHVRKLKGYAPETWRYRIGAWNVYTFRVYRSWKGLESQTVDVAADGLSLCEASFDIGKEYLVFAGPVGFLSDTEDHHVRVGEDLAALPLWTSPCSLTGELRWMEREELQALGAGCQERTRSSS